MRKLVTQFYLFFLFFHLHLHLQPYVSTKYILCYLRGTMGMCMFYFKIYKLELIGYADACYLSDLHNGRSQKVICLFVVVNHTKKFIKSCRTFGTTSGMLRLCLVEISNSTHTINLCIVFWMNKYKPYTKIIMHASPN